MTSGENNYIMDQGAAYNELFEYTDDDDTVIDLTGYTGRMKVRLEQNTTSTLYLTFSTDDGTMVLGGALGTVQLIQDATVMSTVDFDTAYYDLFLYPNGDETLAVKPMYGYITLRKRVTD